MEIKEDLENIIDSMLKFILNRSHNVEEGLNIVTPYIDKFISIDKQKAQNKYNVLNMLSSTDYNVSMSNSFNNIRLYNEIITPLLYK